MNLARPLTVFSACHRRCFMGSSICPGIDSSQRETMQGRHGPKSTNPSHKKLAVFRETFSTEQQEAPHNHATLCNASFHAHQNFMLGLFVVYFRYFWSTAHTVSASSSFTLPRI